MDIHFLKSKSVHIVGINGIGMSALAIYLKNKGVKVTGSDITENNNTKTLNKYDIKVVIGHKKTNVLKKDIIFYSSAIKNNPELIHAKELNIPLYSRAKLLQIICKNKFVIAVSGSHGKTTTTSLLGHILDKKGLNPIIISGGVMKNYGQNIHLTDSEFVVVEADESDGTVFKLIPNYLIYLNVDKEHLDYYKSLSNLQNKVETYIKKLIKKNTKIFLNGDDKFLKKIKSKNINKFGFDSSNQTIIKNIKVTDKKTSFDLVSSHHSTLKNITSNLLGHHNAYNIASVCCVLNELGIRLKSKDLLSFQGVERRMNSIGTIQSSTFIDDYAHHPLEIEKLISVIRLFRQQNKFLIIEPHRYSRLNLLYNDYLRVLSNFGNVIILDTYTAGESLKKNWKNSKDLVNDLNTVKSKKALYINDYQDLFEFLDNMMKKSKNNLFIFAGAGSISRELKTYYARRI